MIYLKIPLVQRLHFNSNYFSKVFDHRFQCNSSCKNEKDDEEREACEKKFCKSVDEIVQKLDEKEKSEKIKQNDEKPEDE